MKNYVKPIITLGYIVLIGDMFINSDKYIFKEEWMLILNLILLCLGFYYFIQYNKKSKD